jgi:demethylmenaquinone methyltransferase/2-methoxy-6-polyprenyl-1,4-benzoquinol methylase
MRVVRPGGRIVVLESSPPKKNLLRPFILFHLNYIIPFLGKLVAGDSEAYSYLPDSTQQFQEPQSLVDVMRKSGLVSISYELAMFGTIALHCGRKPDN